MKFEGNHAIKARDLRRAMKDTKGKTLIALIDKSGRLDQGKLREDLDNVRELYQNKGYVDVDIPETRVQRLANGDVNLVVVIREGPQYRVGTLSFEGTQVFTDAEIRRFLKMKEGAIYSPKGLKDDVKTIQDYYGSRGYVDGKVTPEGLPGRQRPRQPEIQDRGGRRVLRRARQHLGQHADQGQGHPARNPAGPGRHLQHGARRGRQEAPGKPRLLREGRGRRRRTPSCPTASDLDVLVQEKRTGSLSLGAGFSSIDSLVGQIELTQANFDITNFPTVHRRRPAVPRRDPVRRHAQGLRAVVDRALFPRHAQLAVGGELFYHDNNYISNDYDQQNLGFDVNVRRALGRFMSASLEYRFESVDITDVNTAIRPSSSRRPASRPAAAVRGGLQLRHARQRVPDPARHAHRFLALRRGRSAGRQHGGSSAST